MEFSPYVLEAAGQVRTSLFGGLEGTWTSTGGTTEATFPRYAVSLEPFQRGSFEVCLIRARRNETFDSVTSIFGKMDVTMLFAMAAYTVDSSVRGGRLRLVGKTQNLVNQVTRNPTEFRGHIGNQIQVEAGKYYALASLLVNYATTGDYPILGTAAISGLLPASVGSDFPVMYGWMWADNIRDFPETLDMSSLGRSTRAPWLAFSNMPKG
ncbi:hypothetical protein [Nocardia brasiliensis]|uniref:hypothetical protein n=1 Tax=Nocardia brasiliensis TaxID=37326 RepID=UPI00366E4DB7